MASAFASWALDPARTLEERFGIQLLVELLLPELFSKADWSWNENYEATQLRHKTRALNPAYQPDFTAAQVEQVATKLSELKTLSLNHHEDRLLGSLAFLPFLPKLEELRVGRNAIDDWSPITALSGLRNLFLGSSPAVDFRPLGELTTLESLHMWPSCPWPDLRGFDHLTRLKDFYFSGNKLALRVIPSLPAMRKCEVHHNFSFQLPIRDLYDLPEMPELRILHLDNTWRLDGIERYPQLRNLEIYGYFDNLVPLRSLSRLTHLMISGGGYPTLAPLAQLPELRRLTVRREVPQDYSVLTESPKLRQLNVEICQVNQMEVATLNAALPSWAEDFGIAPPRPLAPLRLLVKDEKAKPQPPPIAPAQRRWEENPGMSGSEISWFDNEVRNRLTVLLGQGWGRKHDVFTFTSNCHITVSRLEDIDELPAILETIRQLLAACRYPWRAAISVDSLARYEKDRWDDEEEEGEEEEFDAETERANWEYAKKMERERREFHERFYRYQLKREEGAAINPEDFAPKLPEPEREVFQPEETSPYDPASRLSLDADLFEHALFVKAEDLALAEYLTGLKADSQPAQLPEEE